MRRVNRQRCQHRPHLRPEILHQPGQVWQLQLGHVEYANPIFRQGRHQILPPASILVVNHLADPLSHRLEGLGSGQPVHAALDSVALNLLLYPGDANLEEFVEVRTDDAKELQPLQQWILGVERLVQHALIELQPAQFTIDELSGAE